MTRTELWSFLNRRADEALQACRREWQQAQAGVRRLQEHRQRLERLQQDYAQRQQGLQGEDHQVHQTAELRHTVRQLLQLHQRAALELQAAQAHEEQCRLRMQRAEAEALKTQTLHDQALREQRIQIERAEQRRSDAAAVGRHWMRRLAEPGG